MTQKQNFYVTTPIYYWNGLPHVGHFYSSTIANTIYKYHKIHGYNSRFTTWIDENSQKAVIKAEEEGMEIMDYLDSMAEGHKKVWDHFNFDYTDFIRTTETRHSDLVQTVLQKCFDKWDIYEGEYEWMYCVGCESFKKDDDLVFLNKEQNVTFPIKEWVKITDNIIKVCPDHLKTPDTIKEKNYFFKLSNYQTWTEEFYKANPEFCVPQFRFNEVIAFVERWLEDFSISRETNTFGIKLPFDDSQVTYVWFDALFNYYTSCISSRGWDKDNEDFSDQREFWEGDDSTKLHVVWKDIIRFHAIFWPAMLASYFDLWEKDAEGVLHYKKSDNKYLPSNILCGGHFTVDGQKMSKTIGNVIDPVSYSDEYSHSLLTLYMLSAFPIGNDWDYDRKNAILSYNAKLANNFGNLLNRVVVLTTKLDWSYLTSPTWNWVAWTKDYLADFKKELDAYNLKWGLDETFMFLDILNKYADTTEPWKLVKEDSEKANTVLYTLAEWLREVWLNLYCFFPEKMWEMFDRLWLVNYVEELEKWNLDELRAKTEIFNIEKKDWVLFERFEVEK